MSTRRLTRLCNGFSRKLTHHTAAISLFVAHHNFCKIHSALRVTPAMEAGVTDHVWSTEELVDRALEVAGEDVALPEKKPLRMPEVAPEATPAPVRALPNGRGFLRLVASNDAPAPRPAPPNPEPPPAPIPTPAGLAAQQAPAEPPGQLDLFAWKWQQLSLFDDNPSR